MKAFVTVIGHDCVGIIARVCACLAALDVNILDISQTILQENFTMVMAVDLATSAKPFGEVSTALEKLGEEMGLSIRIQRQEIFDAMHRI